MPSDPSKIFFQMKVTVIERNDTTSPFQYETEYFVDVVRCSDHKEAIEHKFKKFGNGDVSYNDFDPDESMMCPSYEFYGADGVPMEAINEKIRKKLAKYSTITEVKACSNSTSKVTCVSDEDLSE